MGNGFMVPGGSNLPDRNTVGKNGCIGMNSSYPNVALNVGDNVQVTNALDGNTYLAMKPPEGEYDGGSYVGTLLSRAIEILNPVPVYAFSCTGTRQASPQVNADYVSASGLGPQWKGTTGTVTIKKAGYYTVASAHYREVGSSPRFVLNGTSYYDGALAGAWLPVNSTIEIHLQAQGNSDTAGAFWSYGIAISCVG